jgi:hypothetical protein
VTSLDILEIFAEAQGLASVSARVYDAGLRTVRDHGALEKRRAEYRDYYRRNREAIRVARAARGIDREAHRAANRAWYQRNRAAIYARAKANKAARTRAPEWNPGKAPPVAFQRGYRG